MIFAQLLILHDINFLAIYVMESSNLKIEGNLYSYADDTTWAVAVDTWHSLTKEAENSLSKIIGWFSNNNLSLNYNKTVCVTFSNSIKTSRLQLY